MKSQLMKTQFQLLYLAEIIDKFRKLASGSTRCAEYNIPACLCGSDGIGYTAHLPIFPIFSG